MLIERAVAAINEKIELVLNFFENFFRSISILKFSKKNENTPLKSNDSTSFMTNEWLSDETSLNQIDKLCETLFPMQIIEETDETSEIIKLKSHLIDSENSCVSLSFSQNGKTCLSLNNY